MNDSMFSGVWRDPALHVELLRAMERHPPFGAGRDLALDAIHAALVPTHRRRHKGAAKLTRSAVEKRVEELVDTRHEVRALAA